MVNDSEEIKKRRISTFLIGEKASHVKAVYGERNMVTNFDASPAADIELESPEEHDKEWQPPHDVNFCLSFGDDTAVRAPPGILQ